MSKKRIVEVTIGERSFSVPPMNLVQLEEYLELQDRIKEQTSLKPQLPLFAKQVMVALRSVAPDLTEAQVKEACDLDDIQEVSAKLGEIAGLVKTGADPREAPSTSPASTETSQPQPDGPSGKSEN